MTKHLLPLLAAGLACTPLLAIPARAASRTNNLFPMVVSAGAAGCLPAAKASVAVTTLGTVENMHIVAAGLPANTDFDLFVIQVPNAPFGLAIYEGDLLTDAHGVAVGDFVGRYSEGTFVVAPGVAPAPTPLTAPPFPDANTNPATPPVQLYHLGLWFDSATDAGNDGCAYTQTPFNSQHNAGIQVLNTSNFPGLAGPLIRIP